jgi:AmmeMemoRadiSam system protein B/AmmeMemoRadiSam system protein A
MNTRCVFIFAVFAISLVIASRPALAEVRKPAWAGQFYEADPARLAAQVDDFLKSGSRPASGETPWVLIAPHAGYPYSGRVAGKAYAAAAGADYETVIIIAPSHYIAFEGCSVETLDAVETPLGVAAVDKDIVKLILRESGFSYVADAHAREHAVEVQIPFIQKALPRAKIVPIIMGTQDSDTAERLARVLFQVSKSKKILVVASTDMSHYLSKKEANVLDASTINLVKSLSTAALLRKVERQENVLCGGGGVAAALLYAEKRGPVRVEILQYADSSDAGTPESNVVGYFAAALYARQGGKGADPAFSLSAEEKHELARVARRAVEEAVTSNRVLEYETKDENLLVPKGVFVTLTKKGVLRGCIGFIEPIYPLVQAVIQTAYFAALRDMRFEPVSTAELKDLEVEISVLSPLQRCTDIGQIIVGKHGLVISRGGQKGLLLPQVAVENGWTRDQFLEEACLKAGLPSDAWKKGAEIETFEAVIFR